MGQESELRRHTHLSRTVGAREATQDGVGVHERPGRPAMLDQEAWLTVDMLKSGTRTGGMAARVK